MASLSNLIDGAIAHLHHPSYGPFLALSLLALAALATNFVVKRLLLRIYNSTIQNTAYGRDADLKRHPVIPRLSNLVPALVVAFFADMAPISATLKLIIQNSAHAFIILTCARTISALMGVVDTLYHRRPEGRDKPIKTYLQTLKIVLYIIATLLMIGTLMDRSPVILLSGLGAVTAVLVLVFQDTLLSIVAGIQLSSNKLIRIGDWIEMKSLNANGEIVEIQLHTVKVQNWDMTYANIPIRKLVTDAFINWRGMRDSGGRRIMRAICIDQNSIHFLTDDEIRSFEGLRLLKGHLEQKRDDLNKWNAQLGDLSRDERNTRRLTNLGLFRAYMIEYLRLNPNVRQDMRLTVRQREPGPTGIPLEVYCFAAAVEGDPYEEIQSDIFDHMLAALPMFGLAVYQNVSSSEFRQPGPPKRAGLKIFG